MRVDLPQIQVNPLTRNTRFCGAIVLGSLLYRNVLTVKRT
uniref:Uncharacterized protein n=1 Tax=Arundo donax TaxID=35708 RepID=A0A0A9DY67_ARUDO